uniref:Odorant receptor n=1 Tax=Anopheles epiroticus TaxID=199890 RepID=A0A182PYY0_9DIPT
MATVESFRKLLKSLINCSKVIGVEIWTAPGKLLPASYFLFSQVLVYYISTVYTVRKYSGDTLRMMKVLITLGTTVQLSIKWWIGHAKANEVQIITNEIEVDLLGRFENGSAEADQLKHRTGRIVWLLFRVSTISMTCASVGFGLYPLFVYMINGAVMPLFMFELQYIDLNTTTGYVMNLVFLVNIVILATVGAILSDFMFFMNSMYAIANADIFIVHMHELEIMLNERNPEEKLQSNLRDQWIMCMSDHQQTTSFLSLMEDIYGFFSLVQVVMGVITLCDGMLLVALTDWYPSYCFLLAMFTQMSIYFVIGHFVELKIHDMYDKVISMPWYKLPPKEQKEFGLLMCRQQRVTTFTACGLMTMNFEAYMSVLRALYQFFVMLMQYVA